MSLHDPTADRLRDSGISNNRNNPYDRVRTTHIRNRVCCKTFLNVTVEIKLSKRIDRILVKVQFKTKSIMGLPVIILVVTLLVVVLRFVVVFLVIGLLK